MIDQILVVIPVLDRPANARPVLASLEASQGDTTVRAVFLPCPDDQREIGALKAAGADYMVAPFHRVDHGQWAKKINWLFPQTAEPFLLLAADDVRFHPGWADRLMECAEATGAGVIGTLDKGNSNVTRGDFSTHPLVRRSYIEEHGTIDQPGRVLHDGYRHNFPDHELALTAKHRGLWAFCPDAVVEHLHPHWHKGTWDATYTKGEQNFGIDRRIFAERSKLWVGTPRP